jgi:hypothetical protein
VVGLFVMLVAVMLFAPIMSVWQGFFLMNSVVFVGGGIR